MDLMGEGWAKFRLRRPLCRATRILACVNELWQSRLQVQMTMSGKAISVYDPKPMAYRAVRVWLSDGSRILGMWTGTKWWSLQGEIKPVRWQLEERKKKKTDKLRKVISKKFA